MSPRRTPTASPSARPPLTPEQERHMLREVLWPSHEPLAFMRRRGGTGPQYADYYERYHAPENVARWARLLGPGGMVILHFFKGMGLRHERAEIERTRAVAREMHRRGMRVSLYLGGTMHTEWFYKEVPAARRWAAVDASGRPITYMSYQLWRHFACINQPGYRAYVRRVIDVAIDELDADNIHFDNQVLRAEPQSCRCAACRRLFPRYVAGKYTAAERIERFGYADVSGLQPPEWSERWPPQRLREIVDPAIQEWVDFRCRNVHDFLTAMRAYIRRKKPTCTASINIKGLHPRNDCFECGIDHGRWQEGFVNTTDAGVHAGLGPRGNLVAEFRAFKASHTTGLAALDDGDERGLFLSMVMSRRMAVPGVGLVPNMGEVRVFGPLGRFLRDHEHDLYGQRPIFADVGVLRSFASMAYNSRNWSEGPYLAEQGLWEDHIPFGIVFDQNLDDLARYRVVLLANQEALGDDQVARLAAFVRAGGGLVATGRTGHFDAWRRARAVNALTAALGLPVGARAVRLRVGRGRVAYLPDLVPDAAYADDLDRYPYGNPENSLPPRNWRALAQALRWAAGGTFTFEVRSPRGVAVEYRQGPTPADRAIHLMPLTDAPPRGRVVVEMATQGRRWTLTCLAPQDVRTYRVAVRHAAGRVRFSLPRLHGYTVCVLSPGGSRAGAT